jgi:hypothetical protein
VCIDAVRVLAEAIDLNVRYWAEEAQEMRAELRRLRVRNEDLEQDNAVLRASIEGQTLAFAHGRLASSPAPLPTVDEVEVVDPDVDEDVAWEAVAPVAVRPAPGEHEDDYLPLPERGRRRRRR